MKCIKTFVVILALAGVVACESSKSSNPMAPSSIAKTFSVTMTLEGANLLDQLNPYNLGAYGYAKMGSGLPVHANSVGVIGFAGLAPGVYEVEVGADSGFAKRIVTVTITDSNITMDKAATRLTPIDDWKFVRGWTTPTATSTVATDLVSGATRNWTTSAPAQMHWMFQVWMKDPANTLVSINHMYQNQVYTTNGLFYGLIREQGPIGSRFVEVFHKDFKPCQLILADLLHPKCVDTIDMLQFRWVTNSTKKEYAANTMPFVIHWTNK